MSYSSDAAKALLVHGNMRARIRKAVNEYAANPQSHANQIKALAGGGKALRMRVGDLRVVFEETAEQISVTKIGPRGSIYE